METIMKFLQVLLFGKKKHDPWNINSSLTASKPEHKENPNYGKSVIQAVKLKAFVLYGKKKSLFSSTFIKSKKDCLSIYLAIAALKSTDLHFYH